MSLSDREVLAAPQDGPPSPEASTWPWVSVGLLVAFVAAYAVSVLQGGQRTSPVYEAGLLYGPWVREQGESWRIFTTVFTHAGPLHLFMNGATLWSLASPLERRLGHSRLLLISLITALGSGLFILGLSFEKPTVGASGMILGYLGVILPLSAGESRKGLMSWLLQLGIISILPGVSWQGHLGGFLAGLPLGWALRKGPSTFSWLAPLVLSAVSLLLLYVLKQGAA